MTEINPNPFYSKLEEVVKDELTVGGLKPWTPSTAESFHRCRPRELIESDYFLNMKEIIYPFHLDTIEELYKERANRKIDVVVFIQSIGAGKTLVASALEWLEWFYFSTTPNPKEAFPFVDTKNSTTAFILMSRDADKARKVVFTNVYRMFQSQFNKEYFPPDIKIKRYLDIPRNHTLIFPGTGEAVSALGFNVYSAVVDEAAFLQQAAKDSSSEEVDDQAQAMFEQLNGRIYSRFQDNGGLIVFITSANKFENWVELKAKEAQELGIKSNIFFKRAPLWVAKPKKFFPSGQVFLFNAMNYEIITDEDMIEEYMQAKSKNDLPKDFNPLLGGLLL
jgi:hypothetical protein